MGGMAFVWRSALAVALAAVLAGLAAFVLAAVGAGPTLFYVLGLATVAIIVFRVLTPVGLPSRDERDVGAKDLPEFIEDLGQGGGGGKTQGALEGVKDAVRDVFRDEDDDAVVDEDDEAAKPEAAGPRPSPGHPRSGVWEEDQQTEREQSHHEQ
jgi:hypothetical protein